MKRIITIITLVFLVSACETTRETQTGNVGATTTTTKVESSFDRVKAADRRVGAGLTYLNNQNYQRAKFHLDKALEYNPDSGNVHYALGIYFQRVKEYKSAEKHFEEALSIDKKRPEYLNAYGAFLCEKGEYKKAEKMFDRAIDIPTYTEIATAYFNVGFCAIKQNDVDKASEYFRKALNRDRYRADALIEMAKIEYGKQRYQRANSYLTRYNEKNRPTAESAWLGLRTAFYLGNKDLIASYATTLEVRFPDSEETAEYLDNKDRWM